jgi:hypothetical protein
MLACLEPDGGPYGLPIGYIYAAEWFYFRGRERAAWALYLQEDSRAGLCVADDEGRRVLVKGNAELLEGPAVLRQSQTGALWIEKATRAGWLEGELTMAAEPFWYFRVRTSRVITSNGPWAKRYKHYEW